MAAEAAFILGTTIDHAYIERTLGRMAFLAEHELERLWKEFKVRGNGEARAALISNYAHLVKITSGRIVGTMPYGLDREDLIGAGTIGLVKAVDQFDTTREVKFETYAIALIRGAILEMLRGEDWVPRSIREKLKAMDRAFVQLEVALGRPATESEVAGAMGITTDDLNEIIAHASRSGVLSLDEVLGGTDGEESIHFIDLIVDEGASPLAEVEGRAVRELLVQGVDKLPDRERLVISLYYYEGLTFKEIGQVLGVSESRVYQLHTQAMSRVRAFMSSELGSVGATANA
jgi:RNA polymerase sigma factor for flagellar operon FliA